MVTSLKMPRLGKLISLLMNFSHKSGQNLIQGRYRVTFSVRNKYVTPCKNVIL